MTTAAIRQKLHNYLETATDKKIKAIYTLVENEVEETIDDYPEQLKAELDRRDEAYKNGTEKIVTAAESKRRISKLLRSAKK